MTMLTPKQLGFTMPPEWHPHTACWMAWPCHLDTWASIGLDKARLAYSQIAKAIAEFEPVIMLVDPNDEKSAKDYLSGNNITIHKLPINDSWTRDTGPTFLLNKEGELAGVDWIHNAWGGNYNDYALDNQIATAIIQATHAKHFKASIIMEGGSFHVDGAGTILTTRECLLNPNRNPTLSQIEIEENLHNFLGTNKVIWLNRGIIGDGTDGHIDEIACFIAPSKVLCLITSDKQDENYERFQENYEILTSTTDATGRSLEVITIEQPPATYLAGERLTLSYVNFYLANQGIVMPAFGHKEYDKAAHDIIQNCFPNYKIKQLKALDIFAGGGGIHCITQQQPLSKKRD
nr:agmatine deiminase family protein [Legionella busanensis]